MVSKIKSSFNNVFSTGLFWISFRGDFQDKITRVADRLCKFIGIQVGTDAT
jgi:hypothetical protein